jgi:hypothetical protein
MNTMYNRYATFRHSICSTSNVPTTSRRVKQQIQTSSVAKACRKQTHVTSFPTICICIYIYLFIYIYMLQQRGEGLHELPLRHRKSSGSQQIVSLKLTPSCPVRLHLPLPDKELDIQGTAGWINQPRFATIARKSASKEGSASSE